MSAPQSPRVLSWQQLVLEADPNWQRDNLQPWIYEFSNRRLFYATIPMYGPASDGGLINDGGFLMLEANTLGWPTSATGLPPGTYYANGLFVNVVLPVPAQSGVAPLVWPGITASSLLLFGSAPLANSPQIPGSGQLFVNGEFVCVA